MTGSLINSGSTERADARSDNSNASQARSVGIVVVNYNAGDWLQRSIEVALSATGVNELVVVDNASTDGSLDRLLAVIKDPRLRAIRQSGNYGFGRAVNAGVAELSSTYVLLLNPDCFIRATTVDALVNVLQENEAAAICGPVVLDVTGREQRGSRRHEPTPLRAVARTFGHSAESGGAGFDLNTTDLPEQPVSVDAVSGSCLLLRRTEFEALGGMDEEFFLHCEDLDLCRRYRNVNKQILFVPSTSVIHLQGGSGRNLKVEWFKHRSMLRYHAKHAASRSPGWLNLALRLGVWSRFSFIALPRTLLARFQSSNSPAPERLLLVDQHRPVIVTGFGRGASLALVQALSQQGVRVIAAAETEVAASSAEGSTRRSASDLPGADRHIETPVVVSADYLRKVVRNELGAVDLVYSFGVARDLLDELPHYARLGIRCVVAIELSGASKPEDSALSQTLTGVADQLNIRLVILKPTITYGDHPGADLYRLQELSHRFSTLPMLGHGEGLRQPLHIDDLLSACQSAAENTCLAAGSYCLGGAETLAHAAMIESLLASQRPPVKLHKLTARPVAIPKRILAWLKLDQYPGMRPLIPDSSDHICDNQAACADLGFRPRPFNRQGS